MTWQDPIFEEEKEQEATRGARRKRKKRRKEKPKKISGMMAYACNPSTPMQKDTKFKPNLHHLVT